MTKVFMIKIDRVQPSQLFISSEKLSAVMKTFDPKDPNSIEPIPIKRLGKDIIFTDGHTRAFAAFLKGFSFVPVYWEDAKLDLDAYKICVRWCRKEKIRTIADLKNRIVSQKDYELLWYKRCEEMQQTLELKRRKALKRRKSKLLGKGFNAVSY